MALTPKFPRFDSYLFGDLPVKNNLLKFVSILAVCFVLIVAAGSAAFSQTPQPELSVAGFRLGDEAAAKNILQNYSPRYDNEQNRPQYFFYNGYGNQVMTITAYSKERPFLIMAIEVFAVGESYQKRHYQLEDTNYFTTESGFFIGWRQSTASMILGGTDTTGPKDIIKKKGVPAADENSGKIRTLRYKFGAVEELEAQEAKMKDINFGAYSAEYRFNKNKLSRFSITVDAAAKNAN